MFSPSVTLTVNKHLCNNSCLLLPTGAAGVTDYDRADAKRGDDVVVAAQHGSEYQGAFLVTLNHLPNTMGKSHMMPPFTQTGTSHATSCMPA